MEKDKNQIQIPTFMRKRLAHAYVPYQRFTENYQPDEALRKGTLLMEVND